MTLNFNKKLKRIRNKEIELEEVFLDPLTQKDENDFFEKKFEVPLSRNTSYIFFIFILILISLLFIKTFHLQVLEKDKFLTLAENNKFFTQKLEAQRGIIYDRNLIQLVFNQPSFDLVVKKNNLPKDPQEKLKILKEVSVLLKKNLDDLKTKIEESQELEFPLVKNLDYQTLLILETRISELPGFQIKNNTVREYPQGKIFSLLIGYIRKTGEKTGLEFSYDELLKEKEGEILLERDAKGNLISQKIVSPPQSGKNLILWLDAELQKKIYEELEKTIENMKAKGGAVVALDPKSGGVLALVSFPSFDNNLFSKGMTKEEWEAIEKDPLNPLFNRIISGGYQPASVIKPLLAVAALEEKIISPEKKIDDAEGKIVIRDLWNPQKFWEFKDWKIHGLTDMRKAIAQSCNVYFYIIGGGYKEQEGLGPQRIKKYLELFGWGKKTGIDLPGETPGFLPDPDWKKEKLGEPWTLGNTYHYSIGHEFIKVSPLQVAVSFLPIVNGGKLLKPQLVKGILDADNNLIEELKPQIIRENFVKESNLEIVRQGMRQAVTDGSCTTWLSDLPFSVACKTGTAQTGLKDLEGKEYYNAWLVTFAPYDNPEIILVILVKGVKKAHPAVLPLARSILEWYFSKK